MSEFWPSYENRDDPAAYPMVDHVVFTAEQLQTRVAEMGQEISHDYAGREITVVGVLKGAQTFLADLLRHISRPLTLDFIAVGSYDTTTQRSGVVRIYKDLDESIESKHVLIVEDIIDTGNSLSYLLDILSRRNPASLNVATLLDRPHRREVDVPRAYNGFVIDDTFVVGYGMDVNQHYRNLPFLCVLKKEFY